MNEQQLKNTVSKMVAPGKGILAIDESTSTSEKRFNAVSVEHTEEHRRKYRQMLITAPEMEEAIGGYILYDETIRQKTDDGTPFYQALEDKGILPGIKVDKGAKDLALHPGEKVTEGLDGLRERLEEYRDEYHAKFAKWRAVITIGQDIPSQACYKANAHALARYAALCQEAGLVPMVEPEVLMDGEHSIDRAYEVSTEILQILFAELKGQGVSLEGTVLKMNMVISGKDTDDRAGTEEVARKTVQCLKENVPENLGAVVFLSGGQGADEATQHLNAMHNLGEELPWPLSFSYGRAIQGPAKEKWAEDIESNVEEAQKILAERAKANGLASQGKAGE